MDGGLVMMNAASGVYLSLNGTGERIWQVLEQASNLSGVCAALAAEYEAPMGMITGQVTAFLQKLHQYDAVQLEAAVTA
jgi:hypothetical protein